MLNTPPVFAVYVALLTLRWCRQEGGIAVMEARSREKAGLLYETLDALPLFRTPVRKEDRSRMNAVFMIDYPTLETAFLDECRAAGMTGIKGHRSMGGFRVSMYNALPLDSVRALTDLMTDFARRHG